jgi:hypothetical protein
MDGATYAARTKQQLIEQVRAEQAAWEALLEEIGLDRMEIPGVTDAWTMKDTIAHLTTWWRRQVALLAAVQRGQRPPAHPPQSEVAIINQWIFLVNRDRPLTDVLRDAQAVWQEFAAYLQALPEATLADQEHYVSMDGRPLGAGIIDDFLRHLHEEHEPLIRAWLDAQPASPRTRPPSLGF